MSPQENTLAGSDNSSRQANVIDQIESRIQVVIERIGRNANSVHRILDQVVGPRPSSPDGAANPPAHATTILDVVDRLERSVVELEMALERVNV